MEKEAVVEDDEEDDEEDKEDEEEEDDEEDDEADGEFFFFFFLFTAFFFSLPLVFAAPLLQPSGHPILLVFWSPLTRVGPQICSVYSKNQIKITNRSNLISFQIGTF